MLRDQHSADMLLSPFARQILLPLALPIAGALLISTFAMAGRATNTVLEERRQTVGLAHRATTGVTQAMLAQPKAVTHRDTLIEHKTLTLPQALLRRDGFQIF